MDSLYSSSSFSVWTRFCLLLSMRYWRAAFQQPRLSKSFLACVNNASSSVRRTSLRKIVSLLLKPQMFLDRRVATLYSDSREPTEADVCTKKEG